MNIQLPGKSVVTRMFPRWIMGAFVLTLAMTMAQHAIAADPIAEIRVLREARVGSDVRLESTGRNDPAVHLKWKLDRRPKLSKAKISDHNSAATSFRADVPGLYVVELTVRLRNSSTTATLSVTATELNPLVVVNTIDVVNGVPGMTVGSQFFKDGSNGTQLQIVVLDRYSLEGYHNNNYDVTSSTAITQLATNLSNTQNTNLVLVALPRGAPIGDSLIGQLSGALGAIGGVLIGGYSYLSLPGCWASETDACTGPIGGWTESSSEAQAFMWSFSMIGVPGMSAGKAWYDDAAQRGTQQGPLVGYLTPGVTVGTQANGYTFVFGADQYVVVDSCVNDGTSTCAIGVGQHVNQQTQQVTWQQTFDPQPGVNGLHVLVLDRVTLAPILHQTVTSTSALAQALIAHFNSAGGLGFPPITEGAHFSETSNDYGYIGDRAVMVIQSVGTLAPPPWKYPPSAITAHPGTITYTNNDPILQMIDQLGGTPETFAAAVTQGLPYALVGVASNLPWHGRGIESSPIIAPGQPCTISLNPCVINLNMPGHSRGVLARDRRARYTPQADDPVGVANLQLFPIIYQQPTPWPYAGNCAIGYIANGIGLGDYPDIRSAYYSNTNIDWDVETTELENLPPTTCTDASTYAAIKTQLSNEFGWVPEVIMFIDNLTAPFIQSAASISPNVYAVGTTIANSIPVPPPPKASTFGWLDIFNGVMDVAAATPNELAPAFGLIAAGGDLAAGILGNSDGSGSSADEVNVPTANQVTDQANQLAVQLTTQSTAQVAALANLQNILLADVGKLQTVATNASTSAWQLSGTTTNAAVQLLNITTVRAAYSALVPGTWQLYNLKPDLQSLFTSTDVTQYICGTRATTSGGEANHPFYYALAANQFQARFQMVPATEAATTEVWTFANVNNSKFNGNQSDPDSYVTVPTSSLTTQLFAATGAGAGAAYPPAWYRKTYNPPGAAVCGYSYVNSYLPVMIPGPPTVFDTGG